MVTTWLGPTAPFGSGGEQPHWLLLPSNVIIGPGIPILPSTRCTVLSGTTGPTGPGGIGPSPSFSDFVHSFTGNETTSRSGLVEISNFTTRMTPRYCAWTTGCWPDCPEEGRDCASRTIVTVAKQSRTLSMRRSLKKPPSPSCLRLKTTASQELRRAGADWEADFFFIAWG